MRRQAARHGRDTRHPTVDSPAASLALRVGYVNSQGLSQQNWDAVCEWLPSGRLDLVFVAETWYVGWESYSRAPETLAVTPRPTERPGARYTGGMCVVAAPWVAGRLVGRPAITSTTITVRIGAWTISGVYLQPTMTVDAFTGCLQAVSGSDLVLGDLNVRLPPTSMGKVRSKDQERAQVVADWVQGADLTHLQPSDGTTLWPRARYQTKLTVDHCFVRSRWTGQTILHLLQNDSRGLDTDHAYTIHVTVGEKTRPHTTTADLPRFQIGRLMEKKMVKQLRDRWNSESSRLADVLLASGDVDQLNDGLVWLCQQVCEKTLGRSKPKRVARGSSQRARGLRSLVVDQSAMATHRLMRQVWTADRDNGPLQAKDPWRDPLVEMATILRRRYHASPKDRAKRTLPTKRALANRPLEEFVRMTPDEVAQEIARQEGTKACGSDGVHIRVLKALRQTSCVEMLTHLYNTCLLSGTTPSAWNATEIHVLIKDSTQPKTTANVRPITLIGMFRKVFEALLLKRFDETPAGWAHVQPAQAGFRSGYSTLSHAALVHILLDRRLIESIVFLDFRSAFDVVQHDLLQRVLQSRRCPYRMQTLIESLTFRDVRSRVLANDDVSDWFARTCGLLQGSPLSPALFNIFVDSLLKQLNTPLCIASIADGEADATTIRPLPCAVFYADDGALLQQPGADVQKIVDEVQQWCRRMGMQLNVKKCGFLAARAELPCPTLNGDFIPRVDSYRYLGFSMTAYGIDFAGHLEHRIGKAIGRTMLLNLHSRSWGPAHRLRVYRQYLAPMFEYGAALIWAWSQTSTAAWEMWRKATARWRDLVAWIAGGEQAWRVTANLLGLAGLEERFEGLHASFQWQLERAREDQPLRQVLRHPTSTASFSSQLQSSVWFGDWKRSGDVGVGSRDRLRRFVLRQQEHAIRQRSEKGKLTHLIPFDTRLRSGLRWADATLSAPLELQEMLFRYRRGVWELKRQHSCDGGCRPFYRGHEECSCFGQGIHYSAKAILTRDLQLRTLREGVRYTNIDFLLNAGEFERAAAQLRTVQSKLRSDFIIEGARLATK